jgi:predicted protein tyrosine phosphatase
MNFQPILEAQAQSQAQPQSQQHHEKVMLMLASGERLNQLRSLAQNQLLPLVFQTMTLLFLS